MTFEKFRYDIPPRHEGNESDFQFRMSVNFPLDRVTDITFQVRDLKGKTVIEKKKLSENTITLDRETRLITIAFAPADTLGKVGYHLYEIDFHNLQGNPFATIGGNFVVNKQINTL